MNRRKIENWVVFCLKMLPFLFLILFALFLVDNHDFITPDLDNQIVTNLDYAYVGQSFNSNDIYNYGFDDDIGSFFATINDIEIFSANHNEFDILTLYHYLPLSNIMDTFYNGGEIYFSSIVSFDDNDPNKYLSYSIGILFYDDYTYNITFDFDYSYYQFHNDEVEVVVDEFIIYDFNSIVYGDIPYVAIALTIEHYANYGDLSTISLSSFTLDNFYTANLFFNRIYGYDSFTNLDPLSKFLNSFNYFVYDHFNFNLFNSNEFLEWTDEHWFNGNIPIICETIFYILIYELLVDLLYLIYSFICFVIKFVQKWLNGIYNKDW